MKNQFERTELLLGTKSLNTLFSKHVAIFGLGGVGGYVAEALARSGISTFTLIDNDIINTTNINRQIIATHSTLGRYKVDVMKKRILDINPHANVTTIKCFFLPENSNTLDFSHFSYIVDAIDTITSKIELVIKANATSVPIISSMGTGNKLDPTLFLVDDIYNTSVCPLARIMRRELKKRLVEQLKVVYSKEAPIKRTSNDSTTPIPASIAFVPSVAGLIIASEVIKDLTAI